MNKGRDLIRDMIKVLKIGCLAGISVGAVLFLGGFLAGSFQLLSGLEAAKDGLLLIAALGMFVVAGMLLVKGKNPEKFEEKDSWKKHFQILGYKGVVGILCVIILLFAAVMDYLIMSVK